MGIRWLNALIVTAVVACTPSGTTSTDNASFQVRGGQWERTQSSYSTDYKYTALVLGQKAAEHGVWLVAVRVIRDAYVDPAKAPDSTTFIMDVADGTGRIEFSDFGMTCNSYNATSCVRQPQVPRSRVEVIGFLKMQGVAATADSQTRR